MNIEIRPLGLAALKLLHLQVEDVRDIFRRIAAGDEVRGNFLTRFAVAFCAADDENMVILLPAALRLIVKYDLAAKPKEAA